MSTHVINRQIIDLKVQSQKNAFSIQQRVREIYLSEVIPMFDRIMNELTDGDQVLCLDRLEIDLGDLTVDQLDRQLTTRIREKIATQLREKVAEALAPPVLNEQKGKVLAQTSAESKLELLRIFLDTGNIPWWTGDEYAPPDIDPIVEELLQQQPLSVLELLAEKAADARTALRMIFQFSEKTQRRILSHFSPEVIADVQQLVKEIVRVRNIKHEFTPVAPQLDAMTFLAVLILEHEKHFMLSTANQEISPAPVLRAMAVVFSSAVLHIERILYREAVLQSILLPSEPAFYPVLLHYFKAWETGHSAEAEAITGHAVLSIATLTGSKPHATSGPLEEAIVQFLRSHSENKESMRPQRKQQRSPDESSSPAVTPGKKSEAETDEELTALIEAMMFPQAPEVTESVPAGEDTNGERRNRPSLAITRYAGLVLVAPFLPAFFEEMQLLHDGTFKDDAARFKAVHFLHFLATSKTKASEYQQALQKILCGLETTDPVPKNIKLTAADKKACTGFLDDIAEQWTTLQGTSGEAFRETFMKRNGILEQREGALLLRIERGPIDMLLETLPWTISIIRLPWMQQLLHVEW